MGVRHLCLKNKKTIWKDKQVYAIWKIGMIIRKKSFRNMSKGNYNLVITVVLTQVMRIGIKFNKTNIEVVIIQMMMRKMMETKEDHH